MIFIVILIFYKKKIYEAVALKIFSVKFKNYADLKVKLLARFLDQIITLKFRIPFKDFIK